MIPRRLCVLALLPLALTGCTNGSTTQGTASPSVPAASAPAPGVTLPPDPLSSLVPAPSDVPAGMLLVLKGSGPRDLATVAGYSGSGAQETAAAASLTAHGFVKAYVAQYANPGNGQVLSVVASTFRTVAGATADYASDEKVRAGVPQTVATIGDESSVSLATIQKPSRKQLVLVRFRKATTTWSIAFEAAPTAATTVPVALAKLLLQRAG